jgi:4-alpha-glucanotransferase
LAAVHCFGISLTRLDEAPEALKQIKSRSQSAGLEPVLVAWDGDAGDIAVRLPAKVASETFSCTIEFESEPGARARSAIRLGAKSQSNGGFYEQRFRLTQPLPSGYHRLYIESATGNYESLIISAPSRAYDLSQQPGDSSGVGEVSEPQGDRQAPGWGTFMPLYAVRSDRNWGAGDLTDLAALIRWTGSLGGKIVGTLPLTATFLDKPFEPSPYASASRLFWNEFYLDVTDIEEFRSCSAARSLVSSETSQQEIRSLREFEYVDYRRLMALKRRVLELLAREFFNRRSSRFDRFNQFVTSHADVEHYARFRATVERQQRPWHEWNHTMRAGHLESGDYAHDAMQYHLYAQWIAADQMQRLKDVAEEAGCGLYLDLPLGVHRDSFDVWHYQHDYVTTASAGAPPDAVFTKGQNWAFPPLNPASIRLSGYRHLRSIVAHQLQCARHLRIDHVMGLHRLYWIPHGLPANQGVYVSYRADELYAVLCLESHRHQCVLVGEDLGTVPPEVSEHMNRHRIRRMHVIQYETETPTTPVLKPPQRRTVASLNTHDMPTFAAWWDGDDIVDRRDLGLMDDKAVKIEVKKRAAICRRIASELRQGGWLPEQGATCDRLESVSKKSAPLAAVVRSDQHPPASKIVAALFRFLAANETEMLSINLEDLWLERQPQNVPGTSHERANWKRKARRSLEEFATVPDLLATLTEINKARNLVPEALLAQRGHCEMPR